MDTPPAFEETQPVSTSSAAPAFEETQPVGGSDDYWGDVKANALAGAKEFLPGVAGVADVGSKLAGATTPSGIGQTAGQMAGGTPFGQTPVGEGASAAMSVLRGLPQAVADTAKSLGHMAITPFEIFGGKSLGDTSLGQDFRQRPLSTAANVVGAAIPAAKILSRLGGAGAGALAGTAGADAAAPAAAEASGAGEAVRTVPPVVPGSNTPPSYLETQGGRGLYSTTGIRGMTVQKLARAGQNPGAVGTNLIRGLSDEGAIGSTSADTWDKISALKQSAGQDVGTALKAIQDQAQKYGAVDNPLEIDADKALKPILDAWEEHANGLTSASANLAKEFENVHTGLSQIAQKQGGVLTLDDIKKAMSEVGPLTHKGAPETQAAMSELYGTLADTHDSMIETIAKEAKNPSLAANLRNANAKYSRYVRIMPDVSRAAAMESVGQQNFGSIMDNLRKAVLSRPEVSRSIMNLGTTAKGVASNLGQSIGSTLAAPQSAPQTP